MNEDIYIRISSHGENMNSFHKWKRMYYIDVDYSLSLPSDNIAQNIVDVNNVLISQYSYDEPTTEKINGYDILTYPSGLWWINFNTCKMCKMRYEYELQKIKHGEYVWKRGKCLRHYFISHLLSTIDVIDNKPRELEITPKTISASINTNNYAYVIYGNKDYAIVNVNYKGKQYSFKYNNHANAYPYVSTYNKRIEAIFDMLKHYAIVLTDVVNNSINCCNVVAKINGKTYEIQPKE